MNIDQPVHASSDRSDGRTNRKATAAAWIGTTLEFYDYFLYATAAALVFGEVFFSDMSPVLGTLMAFGTNAIGLVVRPLGGIFFGHLGDRIGRKRVLIATLVLMGAASFFIGCLPTYAMAGPWAPIMLLLARVGQGFATGGEHSGGVLVAFESSPRKRRGFAGAWTQNGVASGFVLSTSALGLVAWLAGDDLHAWAWRIPFLLSSVLLVVGLWMRRNLDETQEFSELQAERELVSAPIKAAVRHSFKLIILGTAMRFVENGGSYLFLTFGLFYATSVAGYGIVTILTLVTFSMILDMVVMLVVGKLSDRMQRRKPLYLAGCVAMTAFAFPAFWLLQQETLWALAAVFFIGNGICHALLIGVQTTYVAELFPRQWRYSGVALVHEVGNVVSGPVTPVIATALLGAFGVWAVATYVAIMGVVSLVATLIAPETYAHPAVFDPNTNRVVRSAA